MFDHAYGSYMVRYSLGCNICHQHHIYICVLQLSGGWVSLWNLCFGICGPQQGHPERFESMPGENPQVLLDLISGVVLQKANVWDLVAAAVSAWHNRCQQNILWSRLFLTWSKQWECTATDDRVTGGSIYSLSFKCYLYLCKNKTEPGRVRDAERSIMYQIISWSWEVQQMSIRTAYNLKAKCRIIRSCKDKCW